MKQKRDRYEMHKYWGKKPSNDLKSLITKFSNEGDTVLDPFAGYGVFCCEAFLLNRNIISNDLNPIANFINEQLLTTEINLDILQKQWLQIKNDFHPYVKKWYRWNYKGKEVELISILRNSANYPLKAKIKPIGNVKSEEIILDTCDVDKYLLFEKEEVIQDWYPTNKLIENSRISAKKEMTVADLFTKRTLACHARLLMLINKYSSGNEKNLLLMAFTANLANCSKLVPPIKSRGDMAPGAWMTGFYIGETYLENNVLLYFENRFKKILKGKEDYLSHFTDTNKTLNLFNSRNSNFYRILNNDAKKLSIKSDSIDYIFTDPPYGDAVPYFEQSIIWNSWLNLSPDYDNEIVVTDSKERKKGVKEFEEEIMLAFEEIRRVLKMEGYFSLTYHSLSGAEWKAITNACIRNGFEMVEFNWLVQKSFTPRQINRIKSIKGDVLVTFQKAPSIQSTIKSDAELEVFFKDKIHEWIGEEPLDTNEIFLRIMKIIFQRKIIIGNIDVFNILSKYFEFTDDKKWRLTHQLNNYAA